MIKKTLKKYRLVAAAFALFIVVCFGATAFSVAGWRHAKQVATISQAGLEMGSLVKLGSVHRDDGRLDQARTMWEKALEIAQSIPEAERDLAIQRLHYGALHGLAELYYNENRPQEAAPYCAQAIQLSHHLAQCHPEELEWQRLLAYAHKLDAKRALAQDDSETALQQLESSASIFQSLSLHENTDTSVLAELARVRGLLGKCRRKLGYFDEAYQDYTAEQEICGRLIELEPENADRLISLVFSWTHLAAWHIAQENAKDDEAALEFLRQGEDLLRSRSEMLATRRRDVDRLDLTISQNREIIRRRR